MGFAFVSFQDHPSLNVSMPLVFNFVKNRFTQVHANKVNQRPATGVQKRQRKSGLMKICLALEKDDEEKAEKRAANESE